MGAFTQFENSNSNSNSNTPARTQNMIKYAPFLTNDERNQFRMNAMRMPAGNVGAKIEARLRNKVASSNLSQMKVSPLQLSIFNGMINNDAKPGNHNVDVTSMLYKKPHTRKPIASGSGLGIEVNSIKLLYGRMQTGAKHTFTVTPGQNARNLHKYFVAQIDGRIFENGGVNRFMAKIYTNGKMQLTGGMLNNNINHPEMIRKYIVDTYASQYTFLYRPIKYIVLVGTFEVNGTIDLANVALAFKKTGNIDYIPELRPSLKMTYKNHGFQLFRSGKIQIMGSKTTLNLKHGYNPIGQDLVKQLAVMKLIRNYRVDVTRVVKKTRVVKTVAKGKNTNNTIAYYSKNGEDGVRVGSRKCATIARPKLVSVAEKLGIVDITGKTTKPQICTKIKNKVYGDFKVNGKPCKAYTKDQLTPIAVARGISVSDSDTVESMCEKLKIPKPVAVDKKKKKADDTANKKKGVMNRAIKNRLVKRRLTNATIKEDIKKGYGKRWLNKYANVMPPLNSDVADIKKRINAISNRNKAGVPFKVKVDEIKRNAVRTWKIDRMKNLDNKLNALNNNFAKELENAMNKNKTPPSPKGGTRFLKGTKVEQL
jgi:TATA-box binding protein (TBP) (component of TFIID and TFIIIB)